MSRRASALFLAVLLASAAGCRSSTCGDRCGLFTSNTRSEPNCTLVGSGGRMPAEGCYDGITGQPIPCPPSAGVVPGGTYPAPSGGVAPPNELPYPAPSDMIPRPGVPFAPPSAAPGVGLSSSGATKTGMKQ